MLFTDQKQTGVHFFDRQLAVGIGFVVLESDVVAGQVGLDQLFFKNQRFRLSIRQDQRKIIDKGNHDLDAEGMGRRHMEIGTDPGPKRLRLPDVKDITLSVFEEVDPRVGWEVVQFRTERRFRSICSVG